MSDIQTPSPSPSVLEFFARRHDLFNGGRWVPARHGGTFEVRNPADAAMPFGGFKQSGWGREMGFEAIQAYSETKSVAVAL